MDEKKSSIDSFGVSLGSAPAPSPLKKQLEHWNVLVCSDLGFTSSQPEPLRISELKEFMASKKIVLSGTVENVLERGGKSFFFELPMSSMKDLSPETMLEKIKALSGYAGAYSALSQLINGTGDKARALQALESSGMPVNEQSRVRSLLTTPGASGPAKPQETKPRSGINTILSMVDFGEAQTEEKQADVPPGASDSLIAALAADSKQGFQKGPLEVYVKELGQKLGDQVQAIQKQPFYASRKASWQCLIDCAQAIGRKKEIGLSVFSSPVEEMEEKFAGVVENSIETSTVPDIIIWDFGVTFSNADMELMAKNAETADKCKSALITPLSMDDPFFMGITRLDSLYPLFEDIRFLPFKKLRNNPASRCLCLCAPDIVFPGKEKTAESHNTMMNARSGWALLERWIESLLSASDPFSITASTGVENKLLEDAAFCQEIQPRLSEEASPWGITLFVKSPKALTFDCASTVIDSVSAGPAYSSLAFNLLVNRVARLAVMRLTLSASLANKDVAAKDLCWFLQKELLPYHVLSSPDQVSVEIGKEGEIELTINSDVKVSGFPAQFSFSLNL